MTRMFDSQFGKNIEVYIDDMVVKSKVVSEQVGDLGSIFEILRGHRLRLNASKCSFGVGLGKVLGYMVTHHGIDVNPDQIKVYVDGTANQKGSGVRLVMTSLEKITIEKFLRLVFLATNNEAEYEAFLVGMDMVPKVNDELEVKDLMMQGYLSQVKHLQSGFKSFALQQIPRSRNTNVDSLATLATSLVQSLPRVILVEDLCKPIDSKREKAQIHQVRVGPSWMDSTVLFLKDNILPEEKVEADNVRRKAPQFWLSENHKLYKRSFYGSYLLCIHPNAMEPLLEELHVGICGSHTGGRSTRETPFSITYGVKVVIPLETGFPTLKTILFTPDSNDNLLGKSLDLVEEQRENVMVQLAYYQQKLKKGYDFGVKLRPLAPMDLVLRKVVGIAKNLEWEQLGPNWEGSYHITSVAGICAYFIKDLSENIVPCP
ncbi:uncharacterized protein LOC142640683 [Castanea sativa]|uniref:uncharacterized protein LOC142640683 n=1 Tax=Castanea sativa TaxID=21020 RepID=UPI003F64A79E